MSDSITDIANGSFAQKMKKKSNRLLIGFAAGSVLGIIGGHFLSMGTWKPALLGGVIGVLASTLNQS